MKTKTILTPERAEAIKAVTKAYDAYDQARERERPQAQEAARRELDRLTASELADLRGAIQRAEEVGVPRTMLQTHDVLGSTFQGKVRQLLGETGKRKRKSADVPSFHWLTADRARVVIKGFDTRSTAPDYPPVLSGIVTRSSEAPAGWAVVMDDGDDGDLPGFLTWELDQPDHEGHLGHLLTGLAAKAKR